MLVWEIMIALSLIIIRQLKSILIVLPIIKTEAWPTHRKIIKNRLYQTLTNLSIFYRTMIEYSGFVETLTKTKAILIAPYLITEHAQRSQNPIYQDMNVTWKNS